MADPVGTTLSRFILQRQREHPGARGELSEILEAIGLAARVIARAVTKAGLGDLLGVTGRVNVQGEQVQRLDAFANEAMIAVLDHIGRACILASEENEEPIPIPPEHPFGNYAIAFDPLDGSGNIDTNMPLGTIFSIYHRKSPAGGPGDLADLLRTGREQVTAGYVIHGASTMLVYTAGNGVHGFTLDPSLGSFLLSHPDLKLPGGGRTLSINTGNRAYWHPGVRAHVEALEGVDGERGRPYGQRYTGALVADVHRILLDGGLFMYPADTKSPGQARGKLRLLYECAPLAFVVEQAGGKATDGHRRILDVACESLHQRTPLFIGSRADVEAATAAAREDPA